MQISELEYNFWLSSSLGSYFQERALFILILCEVRDGEYCP